MDPRLRRDGARVTNSTSHPRAGADPEGLPHFFVANHCQKICRRTLDVCCLALS